MSLSKQMGKNHKQLEKDLRRLEILEDKARNDFFDFIHECLQPMSLLDIDEEYLERQN